MDDAKKKKIVVGTLGVVGAGAVGLVAYKVMKGRAAPAVAATPAPLPAKGHAGAHHGAPHHAAPHHATPTTAAAPAPVVEVAAPTSIVDDVFVEPNDGQEVFGITERRERPVFDFERPVHDGERREFFEREGFHEGRRR